LRRAGKYSPILNAGLAVAGLATAAIPPKAGLYHSKQPQDEDQEQDSAKTDVHSFLHILFCIINRGFGGPVPIVTVPLPAIERVLFYLPAKQRICLTFAGLSPISPADGGAQDASLFS